MGYSSTVNCGHCAHHSVLQDKVLEVDEDGDAAMVQRRDRQGRYQMDNQEPFPSAAVVVAVAPASSVGDASENLWNEITAYLISIRMI